ncbi:MAG: phospholipase D family protein [Deltaproteobacteria bacterium]|nr:phospholipase D family protein [Deltaproteobacteria bacterium]
MPSTSIGGISKAAHWALFAGTILLGACATVDFDHPKLETRALNGTSDTYLAKGIGPLVAQHPGRSGFYLQSDGIDALAARFVMAHRAEESIDAQYYLITGDMAGYLFIGSLLQAADRGVRVRLLLDDIQTQGYDAGMAALDSHPNFEVRIFNPWATRSFRVADLFQFNRINRRMHNKSFTADNQITIIGGRNIADEYFGANKVVNFGDVDVLSIGPVVQEVSTMFDSYWNSRYAAPVAAFAKMPDDPAVALEQLRARIDEILAEARQSQYGEAVTADINRYLDTGGDLFTWAPYTLAYDSPDKADSKLAKGAENITTALAEVVAGANEELIVISPYFVPRKSGVEYFQSLIDRGLRVTVITNSLAANNHGIVHSGYMGSRKALLRMGVELYEVKVTAMPKGIERGGSGASLATLHTKAFLVDRKHLFVGSFNWDPRSVDINTELGVVIESKEMSETTGKLLDESLPDKTYQVVLDENGRLRWIDDSGEESVILTKEPDTTWWRRVKANLGRLLPIRGQL